jgi:TolB-like protein
LPDTESRQASVEDAQSTESAAIGSTNTEVVTTDQSIAVLPFVNMSDDKDYFADGLSEELLNLLAKIPDLKVAGRTSSFAFKGKNDDLRTIGDALGVSTVLEGSVRRSGDRLRVTAQLIKVDDGFHIWSETYDRQMTDIFDIQDDVASAITDALKLHLSPTSDRPTNNMDAYALYLQVLAMVGDYSAGPGEAIALLDRAIALDPGFAKAYELKAMTHWLDPTTDNPTLQRLVYEAASKALALDSTLVVARSFSISASPVDWSWINEIEALEEAVEAAPDDVRVLFALAHDLTVTGYHNEVISLGRRAVELEPLLENGYFGIANGHSGMGRREEAQYNWALAAEIADVPVHWYALIDFLVAGEDELAIAGLEAFYEAYGWDRSTVRPFVEGSRDIKTGKAFLIEQVNKQKADAETLLELNNAQVWYLAFGYLDEFWREIDETVSQTDSAWTNADALEHICQLYPAAGCTRHSRFDSFAKDQGWTDLWDKRGAPDNCSKTDDKWSCE